MVVSWTFSFHPKIKETPDLYVPSYVYQPPTPLVTAPQHLQSEKQLAAETGILKPQPAKTNDAPSASQAKPQSASKEDPIHLVGNNNKVPKPLIKLLGRQLTAHLFYPKIAVDFQLRGVTTMSFTLYPDGHITGLKVIKSSGADVLDEAAMKAVNEMLPVQDVDRFLQQPEYMM